MHQISEIVVVKGVTLVGPLPAEIQNFTTYAGAVSATAKDAVAAKAFIDLMAGPAAAADPAGKGDGTAILTLRFGPFSPPDRTGIKSRLRSYGAPC